MLFPAQTVKVMNTLEILLSAVKTAPTLKVWGIAQRAYCSNRITMKCLGKVQIALRKANPEFFGGFNYE
tara:strand:- start:2830 stop:3036 length:207 start_codon:yes stop_codon:yes gene_type:complete